MRATLLAMTMTMTVMATVSCGALGGDEETDDAPHRPRIDSMLPTSGPPGTRVTMTGKFVPWNNSAPTLNAHFVQFGAESEGFRVETSFLVTETELIVEVPDYALSGPLTVFFSNNAEERTALEHPSFEVLHPVSKWEPVAADTARPLYRIEAAIAGRLDTGLIYAIGGFDFDSNRPVSDVLIDLASDQRYQPLALAQERILVPGAAFVAGSVVLAGGRWADASGDHCHTLDVAAMPLGEPLEWTPCPDLLHARYSNTVTTLLDGSLLLAGGTMSGDPPRPTERWALGQSEWTPAGELAEGRFRHTATLLEDGRVLLAGGHPGDAGAPPALATAEVFDPSTDTWSSVGAMKEGRGNHEALRLPDGRVVVVGGAPNRNQPHALGTVEVFDPASDAWTTWPSLNQPRFSHGLFHVEGVGIVVVGGVAPPYTNIYRGLRMVEILALDRTGDPVGGWELSAPLPCPANLPAEISLDDGSVLVVAMDCAARFVP